MRPGVERSRGVRVNTARPYPPVFRVTDVHGFGRRGVRGGADNVSLPRSAVVGWGCPLDRNRGRGVIDVAVGRDRFERDAIELPIVEYIALSVEGILPKVRLTRPPVDGGRAYRVRLGCGWCGQCRLRRGGRGGLDGRDCIDVGLDRRGRLLRDEGRGRDVPSPGARVGESDLGLGLGRDGGRIDRDVDRDSAHERDGEEDVGQDSREKLEHVRLLCERD